MSGMNLCVHVCACLSPTDLCIFLALLYVLLGLFERGLPLCVAGSVFRVGMLLLISMATLVYRLTGTHPGKTKKKVDKTMKPHVSSLKTLKCYCAFMAEVNANIKPISVCIVKRGG